MVKSQVKRLILRPRSVDLSSDAACFVVVLRLAAHQSRQVIVVVSANPPPWADWLQLIPIGWNFCHYLAPIGWFFTRAPQFAANARPVAQRHWPMGGRGSRARANAVRRGPAWRQAARLCQREADMLGCKYLVKFENWWREDDDVDRRLAEGGGRGADEGMGGGRRRGDGARAGVLASYLRRRRHDAL